MKLIIDISEERYKRIVKAPRCVDFNEAVEDRTVLVKAIQNGTLLPKGHGRLIDADNIHSIIRPIEQSDTEWGMTAETAKRLIYDAFDKMPTIVEADNVESEEQTE